MLVNESYTKNPENSNNLTPARGYGIITQSKAMMETSKRKSRRQASPGWCEPGAEKPLKIPPELPAESLATV
jgi:hypothetical protein